jgi:hypothetical protein
MEGGGGRSNASFKSVMRHKVLNHSLLAALIPVIFNKSALYNMLSEAIGGEKFLTFFTRRVGQHLR